MNASPPFPADLRQMFALEAFQCLGVKSKARHSNSIAFPLWSRFILRVDREGLYIS
jgi:hypothetical protein